MGSPIYSTFARLLDIVANGGKLPIALGGTNATDAAGARDALGLGSAATADASTLVTQSALASALGGKLDASAAASTYATQSALTSGPGAKLDASAAASTYATQAALASGLSGKLDASAAASTYATQADLTSGLSAKLDVSAAAATYATQSALAAKAPLASPTFTGVPAAPTASAGTNTTQIATTAFVLGQGFATTTALTSGLATKLDTSTASSTYATQTALTSGLAGKLDTAGDASATTVLPAGLAGAAPRTAGDRAADRLHARDFQAAESGTTDATAQLQAGADASAAGGKPLALTGAAAYKVRRKNASTNFGGGLQLASWTNIDGGGATVLQTDNGAHVAILGTVGQGYVAAADVAAGSKVIAVSSLSTTQPTDPVLGWSGSANQFPAGTSTDPTVTAAVGQRVIYRFETDPTNPLEPIQDGYATVKAVDTVAKTLTLDRPLTRAFSLSAEVTTEGLANVNGTGQSLGGHPYNRRVQPVSPIHDVRVGGLVLKAGPGGNAEQGFNVQYAERITLHDITGYDCGAGTVSAQFTQDVTLERVNSPSCDATTSTKGVAFVLAETTRTTIRDCSAEYLKTSFLRCEARNDAVRVENCRVLLNHPAKNTAAVLDLGARSNVEVDGFTFRGDGTNAVLYDDGSAFPVSGCTPAHSLKNLDIDLSPPPKWSGKLRAYQVPLKVGCEVYTAVRVWKTTVPLVPAASSTPAAVPCAVTFPAGTLWESVAVRASTKTGLVSVQLQDPVGGGASCFDSASSYDGLPAAGSWGFVEQWSGFGSDFALNDPAKNQACSLVVYTDNTMADGATLEIEVRYFVPYTAAARANLTAWERGASASLPRTPNFAVQPYGTVIGSSMPAATEAAGRVKNQNQIVIAKDGTTVHHNYNNGTDSRFFLSANGSAFTGQPSNWSAGSFGLQRSSAGINWGFVASGGGASNPLPGGGTTNVTDVFALFPASSPASLGYLVNLNNGDTYAGGNWTIRRTAAPTSGTWTAGDKCWNSSPAAGQPAGWVYTIGGAWAPLPNL